MNPSEHLLHYPLGQTLPPAGSTLTVAPGIQWLRMGLPFALDHINLWLVRDAVDGQEGWCVIDCGIHNTATKAHWECIFAQALEGLPIVRVLATHMHPDHLGLAHWLCQRWNAQLWISAPDFLVARLVSLTPNTGTQAAAFFAAHGLHDPALIDKVTARSGYFQAMVPSLPPTYRRLLDGQMLEFGQQQWRCISGYGHAPEHIALYCDSLGVLIAGDMLLPSISTNVSVYEQEPEANPLALFLASIDKFLDLPADTLVLPAHGRPFTGLHARIDQLHQHHQERLAAVLSACADAPCCAADILSVLFAPGLDLHQTTFAVGEAIAHLHALWFAGQVQRTPDAKGVYRFSVCK